MPGLPRLLSSFVLVLLYGKLFLIPNDAHAESNKLASKITELLNKDSDSKVTRSVTILTPANQLAEMCSDPILSVSGNDARLTGNRSVIAQCDSSKKFIQIKIEAEGTWWVTNRALKPGTPIQADALKQRSGSMARLPAGVILNKDDIVGQVAKGMIGANQPFVESKLRKRWTIVAGQNVELLASGPGFNIRSRGKAIDNAAQGDTLRVKTNLGQIVSGKAVSEGKVSIFIKD